MLITRVELENIKSYDEGAFQFGPGVTAISGPNGAGKTTILEAIAWALFDHLPYKKEDFLKRGARKGSVRVTFESAIDSREYTVYRDTGAGYYAYDPITKLRLVEQKSQVISWIKQHLGVEPSSDLRALFMSTIGVPQGTFAVDFADQPAKRKISFDRVLRVDEYNHSSDKLRDLVRLIESKDITLREEIARLEVEASSLDPFIAERERLDHEIKRLKGDLAAAQQKRESLKSELQRLDHLQRTIEQSTSESESLKAKVSDLESRKAAASEAVIQSQQAKDALIACTAGFEIYTQAVARLVDLEREAVERDGLKKKYSDTERDLIRVETSLDAEKGRLEEMEAAREELDRLAPLEKEQSELEENRSRIQTEMGKLEALKERAAAAEGDLISFRAEFTTLKKQIEEAESHREMAEKFPALEEARRACESKLRELEVAEQRRRDRLRELGRVREKISNIEGEIKTLEKEIHAAEKAERLAALVPKLEADDQALMEEITALRLSIERETNLIAQIEGGLCPLLSQKCLNMKEGEGLDRYFALQIGNERQQLSEAEKQRRQVQKELSEARAAQRAVSSLDNQRVLRKRYGQELEIERDSAGRLQSEIDQIAVSKEALRDARDEISRIEKELAEAQAARVVYGNLPALRERQEQLTAQGKEKKKALGDMSARIAAMSGLDDE
ncbi:MAG: SMC family ATPase, partial [Acidobacteriota bacterium]